jgi:hypothetical protein
VDARTRIDRLGAIRELSRTIGAARLDEAARRAAADHELVGEPDLGPLKHAVWEVVEAIRSGAVG